MEGMTGIEPASSAWKAEVLATIRHSHCRYLQHYQTWKGTGREGALGGVEGVEHLSQALLLLDKAVVEACSPFSGGVEDA